MPANKKNRALVMFSGGLDSRLVIKLLQEQGMDIKALFFNLPFGTGCCNLNCTFNFSQTQGIHLNVVDCTDTKNLKEYMKIIKNPKHGHGSGLNPCVDCRIFMLKLAREYMKKIKADFIATGEVLNERPMSQHRKAMSIIEEESGLKGLLLRPLSAKLLEETIPEKKGLIDRNKLLGLRGRRRIKQIKLAEKYKIDYPSPAGGCLLCNKEFVKKLKNFMEIKEIDSRDLQLLRIGRHFKFNNSIIIVGRNEKENKQLLKLKNKEYYLEVPDCGSPTTLIIGKSNKEILKKAAELTARYSDNRSKNIKVMYGISKLDKELMIS